MAGARGGGRHRCRNRTRPRGRGRTGRRLAGCRRLGVARRRLGRRGVAHRGRPGGLGHPAGRRQVGAQPGQPGHGRPARLAHRPRPDPGCGLQLARHHDRRDGAGPSRSSPPVATRRPIRRSTPASRCTRDSTTSPCATGSSWPPPCATPTARPAVRRPRAPRSIEYSGYGTAGPTDPIPSLLAQATHSACTGCGDPHLLPDGATDVGAVLARVSGFATVSLQMRGTGCSGGAYDLFGYPSDYDAYDAIEIVAHQGWVAHHKVGMVGHQLLGTVRAALGRHRPARPGRHRPDEPDRRPVLHRVPGRHLQRRLRRRLDRRADRRRQAGRRPHRVDAGTAGDHAGVQGRPALDLLRDRRRAGRQRRARPRRAWPTRPSTGSRRACRPSSGPSWSPRAPDRAGAPPSSTGGR